MEKIETDYGYKKIYLSGTIRHYNHQDDRHNPNGPAVDFSSGAKLYYKHGKLHRTDGPAVIMYGYELHFIKGKYVWKR